MSSINDFFSEIKRKTGNKSDEILLVVIILLMVVTAFGLGRISANTQEMSASIMQAATGTSARINHNKNDLLKKSLSGPVIASNNGEAYHLPWCSGAKRITPENIIWFDSPKEAKEAGYRPAKNCKGIK